MPKKSNSKKWFIPVRGSYLPNNAFGWLTYLPFTAYLVYTLVVGWRYTNSAYQAILLIAPNWVVATVIMTWVAKRTS